MKLYILLSLLLGFTLVCSAGTTIDVNKPLGDLVTLRQIPDAQSVSNIVIVTDGSGTKIDAAEFRHILQCAKPASPDTASGWQFAPWCHGSFVQGGKTYRFDLWAGPLGLLCQPDGTRGLFVWDESKKKKP